MVKDQANWLVKTCDNMEETAKHMKNFQFELDAFTTYEVSDDWKASQRLNPDLSGLKKVTYKKVEKVDIGTLEARAKARTARIAALQASMAATGASISQLSVGDMEGRTATRTQRINQLQG